MVNAKLNPDLLTTQFYLKLSFGIMLILYLSTMSSAQKCQLSDEFDGAILDPSWMEFQSTYYEAVVSNGNLTIDINGATCSNNCPWFHTQSAGFIYRKVAGNFEVIAMVESEEASGSNTGDDISNDTQLGGLLARDGNSATENYVFNVVGTRFDVASVETKSTTNDNSGTIEHFPIAETRAELRMTRENAIFHMYSRALGASDWVHRSTFNRPDLPDTLQVGVIAYAFQSYPEDLAVKVDYVRYTEFSQVNKWLGGDGFWGDPSKWSLNEVPDSSHSIIVDNAQAQTIQILSGEKFNCYTLDVHGALTQFDIDGELEVRGKAVNCD